MSDYILVNGTLYHHGIPGQKWGTRRWQNEDGSLTPAGREHYGYGTRKIRRLEDRANTAREETKTAYKLAKFYTDRMDRKAAKRQTQSDRKAAKIQAQADRKKMNAQYRATRAKEEAQTAHKLADRYVNSIDKKASRLQNKADYYKSEKGQAELKARQEKIKKAAIAGAAVVATGLAAYGAYKIYKNGQLNKEMKEINSHIKEGKIFTDMLRDKTGLPGQISSKVTYLGNDLRYHTAEKTFGKDGTTIYKNFNADTQETFKNLREYKQALKNRN